MNKSKKIYLEQKMSGFDLARVRYLFQSFFEFHFIPEFFPLASASIFRSLACVPYFSSPLQSRGLHKRSSCWQRHFVYALTLFFIACRLPRQEYKAHLNAICTHIS